MSPKALGSVRPGPRRPWWLYGGVDLEEAARRLYAMPLDQFMATRKDIVAQARATKDRELASAVGSLRKPSVAAWLVNQMVRLDPGALAALSEVGERLREAQSKMDGAALRELGRARTTEVDRLVRRADELAESLGTRMSDAVGRELHDTFTAAAITAEADAALRSGRMVRSLSYAGFGDVDISDAVAMPEAPAAAPPTGTPKPAAAETATRAPAADGAARAEAEDAERAAALQEAEQAAALQEAEELVERLRAEVAEITARQQAAEETVYDLEERLHAARAEVMELVTGKGQAARALRTAEHELQSVRGS